MSVKSKIFVVLSVLLFSAFPAYAERSIDKDGVEPGVCILTFDNGEQIKMAVVDREDCFEAAARTRAQSASFTPL